jgi:hypothetical protein
VLRSRHRLSISSYRPLVYAGEDAHQLVECGWASCLEEMRPAQSAAHAMREGVLVAVVFTASHISTSHRSIRVYVGVGFIGISGSGTFKRANGWLTMYGTFKRAIGKTRNGREAHLGVGRLCPGVEGPARLY